MIDKLMEMDEDGDEDGEGNKEKEKIEKRRRRTRRGFEADLPALDLDVCLETRGH